MYIIFKSMWYQFYFQISFPDFSQGVENIMAKKTDSNNFPIPVQTRLAISTRPLTNVPHNGGLKNYESLEDDERRNASNLREMLRWKGIQRVCRLQDSRILFDRKLVRKVLFVAKSASIATIFISIINKLLFDTCIWIQ